MSYDNNNLNNTTTGNVGTNQERNTFDPASTFSSGGLNNSTGREPFEDPRSDFAPAGAPAHAVAGNLHHGHHHEHGSGLTGSSNTGSGLTSGLTGNNEHHQHGTGVGSGLTGAGVGSGLTGNHDHQRGTGVGSGLTGNHDHQHSGLTGGNEHRETGHGSSGTGLTGRQGDHPLTHDTRHHGDIRSGTSEDHAIAGDRHTGTGLTGGILADRQTGDQPGGIQTGTSSYGTGEDVIRNRNNDNRGVGEKIKDAVSGGNNNKDDDYNHRTVGHGAHTGTGLTGGHPGAGVTGASDSTVYGSNTAARDFDQSTSGSAAGYDRSGGVGNQGVAGFQGSDHRGPVSGGAAGTDRFDTDRSGEHGHTVGNKGSDDHKLSGLTRHGDDFTKGDTADSAYKNYDATGLSGREKTTTGVHDNNLEGTGAHKEGIMDKIKHVIGGHTNTTHADHK